MCAPGSKVTLVAAIFGILIGLAAIGLGGWFAATLYLQLPNYQWNRGCTNATAALAAYWDQYYNVGDAQRPIFNLTVPSLGPSQAQCFYFAAPFPSGAKKINSLPKIEIASPGGVLGIYWATVSTSQPRTYVNTSSDAFVCNQNELLFLNVVSNSTQNLQDVVVGLTVENTGDTCDLSGLTSLAYILLAFTGILIFFGIIIFFVSIAYIIYHVKRGREDYNPL